MSEEYVVEDIQGWRYNYRKGVREFFIKWLNYDETDNTWEPEPNLNCPEILDKFRASLPPKQLKYFASAKPKKLTGFQRNAEFLSCVGVDGPHDSDDESSDKAEKQPFYILVTFADCDEAEEVTVKEFFEYQPEKTLQFFENRLLWQKRK